MKTVLIDSRPQVCISTASGVDSDSLIRKNVGRQTLDALFQRHDFSKRSLFPG